MKIDDNHISLSLDDRDTVEIDFGRGVVRLVRVASKLEIYTESPEGYHEAILSVDKRSGKIKSKILTQERYD